MNGLPWGIGAAFRQGRGHSVDWAPPGLFFACRAKGERYWRYVDDAGRDWRTGDPSSDGSILAMHPGVDEPPIDLEAAWEEGRGIDRRGTQPGSSCGVVRIPGSDPSGGPSKCLWIPPLPFLRTGAKAYEGIAGRTQSARPTGTG